MISSLRGRCPKTPRRMRQTGVTKAQLKSSQKFTTFTKQLFTTFLQSRPPGISSRTLDSYHYTLDGFVGCPLTSEGINHYLNSLSCHNGKLKFYSCLRALFNWLFQSGRIPAYPIKQVSPPRTPRVVQALGGWEQISMVERYSKSLTFDDALSIYHKVNGG